MKLSTAIPLASAVALALLCASPVAVRAQTPTKTPTSARVVKLRLENVSLCKLPNGTDCTTYSRAQFKDPWPILGQSAQGLLQVQVGAAKLWVRGYAVETDVRFSVPADCGAVVGIRDSKNPSGPVLELTRPAFAALLDAVRKSA